MIFFKNNIAFNFLFASILSVGSLFAQDQSLSIVNKPIDTSLLAMSSNSVNFSNDNIVIETPSAIPASKLYNNNWNNKDVRLNSDKMFDKNATYVLTLVNETDNAFVFPFKGKVISPFGYRGRRIHTGTDIKLDLNDEVYSAFDGVVRMAKRYSGYGNIVVVRHPNGLETVYSHLNKIKVKVNQEVKAGDLVGLGGRTGRATTTHLHFETRFLGQPFNAEKLLDFQNYTLKTDTFVIDKNTFMKSKKFKYIKNKRGKKVKVYINDNEEEKDVQNEVPINYHTADTNIFLVYNDVTNKVDTLSVVTPKDPFSRIETISENPINENPKDLKVATEKSNSKIKTKSKDKKSKPAIYKVRNGDTLSRIAQKNGTTVKTLCKLNKIDENAVLSLGKKLKVK
jgi:murein DD-endopeptidase MepM/ murein hydrolase activator NlpD